MAKAWKVNACWDDEARVWYVSKTNIPGLVAEAPTKAAFERKISVLVPELLQLNGAVHRDNNRLDVPYNLIMSQRLVARLGC